MQQSATAPERQSDQAFIAFAQQALKILSDTSRDFHKAAPRTAVIAEKVVVKMVGAVTTSEARRCAQVFDSLADSGLTPHEIIDLYVPEVSRRLGLLWESDELSFAVVTIGMSRLQGFVHRLDAELDLGTRKQEADQPKVLVSILPGSQHTIGVCLLASQMRRRGCTVRLEVDATVDELCSAVEKGEYKALIMSAALRESLESLEAVITKLKEIQRDLPIVVGGNILNVIENLGALTGADCVTNDLEEAMTFCGLNTQPRDPLRSASF